MSPRLRGDVLVAAAAALALWASAVSAGAQRGGRYRNDAAEPEIVARGLANMLVRCARAHPVRGGLDLNLVIDEHARVSAVTASPASPAFEGCVAAELVGTVLSPRIRSTRVLLPLPYIRVP